MAENGFASIIGSMHFDERDVGDFRIYAGAMEAPRGGGYTAAMNVQRIRGVLGGPREVLRDDNLACGYRWDTPADALSYAFCRAQEAIRDRATQPDALTASQATPADEAAL